MRIYKETSEKRVKSEELHEAKKVFQSIDADILAAILWKMSMFIAFKLD